jgi:hypothetical protein
VAGRFRIRRVERGRIVKKFWGDDDGAANVMIKMDHVAISRQRNIYVPGERTWFRSLSNGDHENLRPFSCAMLVKSCPGKAIRYHSHTLGAITTHGSFILDLAGI